MKKNILLVVAFIVSIVSLRAQSGDDGSTVKLFLDYDSVAAGNKDLPANFPNRLYTKVTQVINQTGIVDIGYSNFWVTPRFEVINLSETQALSKVYMAECELSILISRREYGKKGGAVYKSFSKKLVGSALKKDEAISKALNGISPSDPELVEFFRNAKIEIFEYIKTHCQEIITEAAQAAKLSEYGKSIALYFSIPPKVPCYEQARNASVEVYKTYLNLKCDRDLLQLRAIVATIQKKDKVSIDAYNEAISMIQNMDPTSKDCYAHALIEIKKIEAKFDQEQKRQWELEQKREANTAEFQKEMVKAMGKINSSYRPGSNAGTIIIAK